MKTQIKQGWLSILSGFLFLTFPIITFSHTITFPDACSEGPSIIIAAVGDVLIHKPLLLKGAQTGFDSLWRNATYYTQSADIAYANLEGPMAFGIDERGRFVHPKSNAIDTTVYTSYPAFNYPPSLGVALKNSGFDIVSTANNHALDRSAIGIDKTLTALKNIGISSVGTRSKDSNQPWVHIENKQGFKIAWISCTASTNGIVDKYHQILNCYRKKDRVLIINTIQELKKQVDAIIVLPHWGEEYQTYPNNEQVDFAHQVLNAGASAIIGSHPHVLQPLQKYITNDGRATFIMYSMGNFVSYQGSPEKRSTIILLFGLTKTSKGTIINGIRFVPMYMQNRTGLQNIELKPVPKEEINSQSYRIMSKVLPMGNALYDRTIVTNPECLNRLQ